MSADGTSGNPAGKSSYRAVLTLAATAMVAGLAWLLDVVPTAAPPGPQSGAAAVDAAAPAVSRTAPAGSTTARAPSAESAGTAALERAFLAGKSDIIVEGVATVDRVLSDDNQGARHQRFIVRMADGRTVLVAHNIDLAPRIKDLAAGDVVAFRGEYEWNTRGGVLHWTHHDPGGRHPDGWLEHNGRRYQ